MDEMGKSRASVRCDRWTRVLLVCWSEYGYLIPTRGDPTKTSSQHTSSTAVVPTTAQSRESTRHAN